jgi:hypothetical protein
MKTPFPYHLCSVRVNANLSNFDKIEKNIAFIGKNIIIKKVRKL